MKILISSLAAFVMLLGINGIASAVTIVEETSNWQSVPVTVDTSANTYTVTGSVPTATTNYYYSYPGYRCFSERREMAGVNFMTFRAGVSGGRDIYCYPE